MPKFPWIVLLVYLGCVDELQRVSDQRPGSLAETAPAPLSAEDQAASRLPVPCIPDAIAATQPVYTARVLVSEQRAELGTYQCSSSQTICSFVASIPYQAAGETKWFQAVLDGWREHIVDPKTNQPVKRVKVVCRQEVGRGSWRWETVEE